MDSVRLERETHWIFPRSVHESARRGMGPEVHGQSDDRWHERHDWSRYKAASGRYDQVREVAMKCELCGKRINEYEKYSAVIGKKEVNLCCWCHKKVKKGNEILREKNESNTKISRC